MAEPPRHVFVVYDGLQSLDLTGPWEVMHSAGRLTGKPPELLAASAGGAAVRTSGGLRIDVDANLADIGELDTLVVVGGSGAREARADDELLTEIRRLAARARRVAGVCSGAYLLAAAGLLDGRRAATHWAHCERLSRLHPTVEVDSESIWVRDGDIYTSAGVTAGIDLALALVEEDHGPAVALEVARWLVVYARRPGGQAQFSVQLAHQAASTPGLHALQGWIAENLDADLSVAALAARLHVSERQLGRMFRRELDTTPADYVESARVERARAMLEQGGASIERIASLCGYRSAEVLRRSFQRRLGTSPRAYRERFQLTPA